MELDELVAVEEEGELERREWQEKSRWIKFEEDVLEFSERWGRPHVAWLSFRNLASLRAVLEHGKFTRLYLLMTRLQ